MNVHTLNEVGVLNKAMTAQLAEVERRIGNGDLTVDSAAKYEAINAHLRKALLDMPSINAALNQAQAGLFKTADVGYQTAAGLGSGNLSALIAQSIEPMVSSATFDQGEIVFLNKVAKSRASQVLHEYARVTDRGRSPNAGFVSEGSAGGNALSSYDRGSVKIKYMGNRREVTDVASLINLIGVPTEALAEQTMQGLLSLSKDTERALFYGDSSIDSLHFDGVIKQIKDYNSSSNVNNLDGSPISMDYLEDKLGELGSAPTFGYPDTIYVTPKVWRDLSRQTQSAGRIQLNGAAITYGVRELSVMGPHGPVPIVSAPFLENHDAAPSAALNSDDAPSTPSITQQPTDNGSGTSYWGSGDAGTYYWKIVAVGAKGESAPVTTDALAVTAGAKPKIVISSSNTGVRSYKVYRSDKDGAASTCKFAFSVACTTGVATSITDLNTVRNACSPVLFVNHKSEFMSFAQLLDTFRRPLAEVETTKPFVIMRFGALVVKVPSKMWLLENVATSTPINPS